MRTLIKTLIALRRRHSALRRGEYSQLHLAHDQLAFLRRDANERVVVALNASTRSVDLSLMLPDIATGRLIDELNVGEKFELSDGRFTIQLRPRWGRILVAR